MRKRTKRVYQIVALTFGIIGFFVADTGQILGFVIGACLGILVVFFAQIFPHSPLPDDSLDAMDRLDSWDDPEEKQRR